MEPNLGIAKVPDPRLLKLEAIFTSKRVVPAEVKYVDVAINKGKGIGGELLTYLSKADALLHVVRAFSDERIPHSEGSIDPVRDIAIMNLELAFSDLAILERRLKRIEDSLKSARSTERDNLLREKDLMTRIKSALEEEVPVRYQELNREEIKMVRNYQFLTLKPLMVLLNIDEEQIPQASSLEADLQSHYPQLQVAAACGKLEMELSQLCEAEAMEFCSTLGIEEAMIDRVIRLSYQLLGLLSFFTASTGGELKAWTVPGNTPALEAAGKIHSDIERGFIRAEVTSYDDVLKCNGFVEARKQGLLRLEGKNYIVQDGDVITFLFNI
jgi:GTP-binding protein YchF